MLVNLKEILADAKSRHYAVGAFNCPNFESLRAILSAAEEMNAPVILNHAQIHDVLIPIEVMGPLMVQYAKEAKVPVCVNLDHGTSFEECMKAIRIGFTSVMYDASGAAYHDNVAQTQEMVRICHAVNVSVEAELGHIFASEIGVGESPQKIETSANSNLSEMYTDPDSAKDFVEKTKVDALAIAFGTSHGIYTVKPVLDLDRITAVKNKIDIPFVMHGGSGLADDEYRTAIRNGITKINYYTYMTMAGADAVRGQFAGKKPEEPMFFHDISLWATEAMKQNVKRAIQVFSMK